MHNSGRLIVYSSSAILLLVLLWGFRQIPQQGQLADQALRESLNQEMVILAGAVKASTQAMKYRLLDVLKAEGNDHTTRTFQDSPFIAAALLEWDQVQWKTNWFSVKNKTQFQNGELKTWMKEWPISKLTLEEVFYTKVADIEGQAYFAVLVPVRKPNMVPMVGVGIFPANQFGMNLSAEENREVRVFTRDGTALALSHPAYLGSSVKSEPLIHEILANDEVSLRHEWKADRGPMIGQVERIADSNLYAAIETRAQVPPTLPAWTYLVLCGIGAALLNWVLFKFVVATVMKHLEQSEATIEFLRRQLSERPVMREPVAVTFEAPSPEVAAVPEKTPTPERDPVFAAAELPNLEFTGEPELPPVEMESIAHLGTLVNASLRALNERIRDRGIKVLQYGLDELSVDGDPLQLQTAVEEVLKNSIESLDVDGTRELTITGHKDNGVIYLSIRDTGAGISKENLGKVFDPFFSTKDAQGVARGLGLNVVRRVVEEMQGRVKLFSSQEPAERGTRVEIRFPLSAEAAVEMELGGEEPEVDLEPTPKFSSHEQPPPLKWDVIRKPKVRTLS